ncbi:malto-oligosyltrehalose synthase [Acuticoccus mangrovi]|uniref:Malto-oligosyltrehalose synthase n=1 Tax=Acuticoccus mangrovi TaxID=2796142 RepID=A0A934MC77_9HYPH|nr:malto-oligosyltrehalose synthase [Acuticoccus mangrovi]MBJ3774972.1 malto-oligosyltrehalose synthase [Acuticoccus mangrovi]
MRIGATYRLQFRNGVGFAEAAAIVPHLAAAGITHLYASPIFAATTGSTHGYDVVDHNALDPCLGGEAGFDRLADALAAAGMGLILDIVPNHMAASTENPWWRDVLTYGEASAYARHFDIDWSAGKLILPILGEPYDVALAQGDIVRSERADWGPVLRVPGMDLPLAPGTETIADLHECHEAQHYRLAHWRLGRDGLTYRRFFEITGLVGVRVEDEAVFDDVHRLLARLVAEGRVQGVRVDHVDGLADPAGYLERLSERLGVPVFVEKILESDETLRPWPVEGTTGYEFIAAMAALFTDADGLERLTEDYGAFASNDIEALTREAKREIITRNLAGELERLTSLALTLFADDPRTRDYGPVTVREGLVALMLGMPVYRTYLVVDAPTEADREVLEAAVASAEAEPLEDRRVLEDLVALLLAPPEGEAAAEFTTRLQQTSGPLMAKAVEDTVFFRHHRLIALNEVGGELSPRLGEERYLEVAQDGGLAATQTHDTKRGEDARARLYALSDPAAVAMWERVWPMLSGELPERWRWAFGQMLFASAPLGCDPAFADRFREAVLKTVREAKEETSWTRADPVFEEEVAAAAEAMATSLDRLAPLADVHRAGAVVGLSQALLKTTARPAADIYQGTFGWDFSMVDPDNRRPVDFAAEASLCESARASESDSLRDGWADGRIKARILLEGLAARRARPELFARGSLAPLPLTGSDADAFAAFWREDAADALLIVVPIRPLRLLGSANSLTLRPDAVAELAAEISRPLRLPLTGGGLAAGHALLGEALQAMPVLLGTSW